jgi:hypothetical protein
MHACMHTQTLTHMQITEVPCGPNVMLRDMVKSLVGLMSSNDLVKQDALKRISEAEAEWQSSGTGCFDRYADDDMPLTDSDSEGDHDDAYNAHTRVYDLSEASESWDSASRFEMESDEHESEAGDCNSDSDRDSVLDEEGYTRPYWDDIWRCAAACTAINCITCACACVDELYVSYPRCRTA